MTLWKKLKGIFKKNKRYVVSNRLEVLKSSGVGEFTEDFIKRVNNLLKDYENVSVTLKVSDDGKHIIFTAYIENSKLIKEMFFDYKTNNYKIRYISDTVKRDDVKKILYKSKEVLTLKGFDTAEFFLRKLIEYTEDTDMKCEYQDFLNELEISEFFLKRVKALNLCDISDKIV